MKGRAIKYLPEELAWIEARKDWPRAQLHSAFQFQFGRQDVSFSNLNSLCKRKGWNTGRTGKFVKGGEPANKGKKMPYHPNSAATRFKPGQRPVNKQQPGYETTDRDGYIRICVEEPNPWSGAPTYMAFKHKWLWEKANGPVPEGYALKCLDGNKRNTDPSNWKAIPRGMLPRLSGRWARKYDDAPDELKPTLMATAQVKHAIHTITKDRRRDRQGRAEQ